MKQYSEINIFSKFKFAISTVNIVNLRLYYMVTYLLHIMSVCVIIFNALKMKDPSLSSKQTEKQIQKQTQNSLLSITI